MPCSFKCHELIAKQGLYTIQNLKKTYPKRKLTVVDFVDPLMTDMKKLNKKEQKDYDGFLPDSVDRFKAAPLIKGKAENDNTRFIAHQRKIVRWLWNQCDYMFTYYYDNHPDQYNTMIKGAKKNRDLTVIHLYDPETKELIERKLQALNDADREMIESVNNGGTYTEYARKRNISSQRIRQCVMRLSFKVERQVRSILKKQKKCNDEWDFREKEWKNKSV